MHPKPHSASIAVVDRCDAKCIMCNIWQEHRRDEVGLGYFKTLPETLRSVNITGGEPFMREDLAEIIHVIAKRCHYPRIVISTNGFHTERIEAQMKKILLIVPSIGIRISIDGFEAMHDQVRRIPGGFQKCMKTLHQLKQLGVKDLGLSFTISPINVGHIAKVYQLAKNLKIEFTFTIAQNSAFYFKTEQNIFSLDRMELKDQCDQVVAQELRALHPKRWFRAYYAKGVYDYGCGKRVLKDCSAASRFFFSGARGEIYPCPTLNQKLGEAGQTSFEEVWHSKKADQIRQVAKDCPVKCWMTCTVGPHFRQNLGAICWWVVKNKIKAHFGYNIL